MEETQLVIFDTWRGRVTMTEPLRMMVALTEAWAEFGLSPHNTVGVVDAEPESQN